VLDDRAAASLGELGIAVRGRRVTAQPWLDAGTVVLRPELDDQLRERCRTEGVVVIEGIEALAPVTERGIVVGATCQSVDGSPRRFGCDVLIVADGANSTFGRALGTHRRRDLPYLVGVRRRWASGRAATASVTRSLQRGDGERVPGLGWALPDDHGGVTVGVTIPSTVPDVEGINPTQVLERLVDRWRDTGRLDLGEPLGEARGGRLPVGGSVGPIAGPTFLVVGDAAAAGHPLTGLGIAAAVRTGALAGRAAGTALLAGDAAALQTFPVDVRRDLGEEHRRSRNALRIIGTPAGHLLERRAPRLVRIAAALSPGG
jgi:flavin-dependent dehydrogenase